MARLRADEPRGDRPPIPERFLRDDGWLTEDELARHEAFARVATLEECEAAAVELGVKAWRRRREASDRWAQENSYSPSEIYVAKYGPYPWSPSRARSGGWNA